MVESKYQADLIKKLEKRFPNCVVLKNDPTYIQGIPDLMVLYENKWAALECKVSKTAHKQKNQPFYVNLLNKMSFASFIYPENEKEVLNELERAFKST